MTTTPPNYVRHTKKAEWGLGQLVEKAQDLAPPAQVPACQLAAHEHVPEDSRPLERGSDPRWRR